MTFLSVTHWRLETGTSQVSADEAVHRTDSIAGLSMLCKGTCTCTNMTAEPMASSQCLHVPEATGFAHARIGRAMQRMLSRASGVLR